MYVSLSQFRLIISICTVYPMKPIFQRNMLNMLKGGDNGEDEEEEESDSDSDWSSEDESDEEGFDDSVCPLGCDQTLFDLAIDMREKRMDLEELLAGETYTYSHITLLLFDSHTHVHVHYLTTIRRP